MTDTVLFIGVGRMGGPMAMRLREAGVPLAVADLSEDALAPFRALGVPAAATGCDLPGSVVISMLPTAAHVREALLGEAGAGRGSQPRQTVIDMTSATPAATVKLGRELGALGIGLMDAPVSGGTAGALAGTLTAMVGGERAAFDRHEALLERMCATVRFVGPLGAGHTLKALNNYLSAVTLWSSCEALLIGTRLGLEPRAMLEVWSHGSGRSHAVDFKLPRHVLTRSFDFGQSLELFCKDIGIAVDLAREAGVTAPALAAADANWHLAKSSLGSAEDITSVMKLLEAWAAERDGRSGA
jgi:3-hydroxyisobutyrate dehydrogenase